MAIRYHLGAGNDNWTVLAYDPRRIDYLLGPTQNLPEDIFAAGGNDTIFGFGGTDLLVGGSGNDQLRGGDGADTLYGGGSPTGAAGPGQDFLEGGAGNDSLFSGVSGDSAAGDTLIGGTGFDRATVDLSGAPGGILMQQASINGANWLSGSNGMLVATDIESLIITGTAFADDLLGGAGGDRLRGGGGEDTLRGGAGNDTITAGLGEASGDLLLGGPGSDMLFGGDAGDLLRGDDASDASGGADTLNGHTGNDTLSGGAGNDLLMAGAGNDFAEGGDGRDVLFGDAGRDTLLGGAGNDTLTGGAGQDELTGGAGADIFRWSKVSANPADADSFPGSTTRDRITDFDTGTLVPVSGLVFDRLDLSSVDAQLGVPGNDAFIFLGQAAFSGNGVGGELRYAHAGGSTLVQGDINGDALADIEVELTGILALRMDAGVSHLIL
jgi:Ca2+-binding RTX toxin-like protein